MIISKLSPICPSSELEKKYLVSTVSLNPYNIYIVKDENKEEIFGANQPVCMDAIAMREYLSKRNYRPDPFSMPLRIATKEDCKRWGVRETPVNPMDFQFLWDIACAAQSYDQFAGKALSARIWGDFSYDDPVPIERHMYLIHLWSVVHAKIEDLVSLENLTMDEFCTCYGVDSRTMQIWSEKSSTIPGYIRVLFGRLFGVIPSHAKKRNTIVCSPADFSIFVEKALESFDRARFAAEYYRSPNWPDCNDLLNERIEFLEGLWDTMHITFDDFVVRAGMSLEMLSCYLAIDQKTAQSWKADAGAIPDYARLMMGRVLGMI
jgi:hypothetical protein